MKALISGSTGLIGSAFLEKHGSFFDQVFTIGRDAGDHDSHIRFDLSNNEDIDLPDVDVFFHFASQTSLNSSFKNVEKDLMTNVVGFVKLLEILRNKNKKPIVIAASTATQVGYTDNIYPHKKDLPDKPITFYDLSKLTAERYLLNYVNEGWLKGCSLRLCNVYGVSKDYGANDRGIIDKIFIKAVNGEKINVFNGGEFVRDYIYIEDVVDSFLEAFKNIDNTNNGIYYIGSGNGITVKDAFTLAQNIASEIQEKQYKILSIDDPSMASTMNSRSFVPDIIEFCNHTGWKPKYNLEQGLRHCYKEILPSGNE